MSKENKKDTVNLESFTTRMDPGIIEKIRAVAWYQRKAQREIIEAALTKYFKEDAENLDEALGAFRRAGQ